MNAALHSPEPPQEESVLEPPPFRAASSESQLDIEADIDLPDVTRDHMAAWEPAPEEPERPPLPEASDEPQQSAAPEQLGFDVQDGPEPLRYVGEIFRTYILAERGDEICIIDKHAAHERMNFDRMKASGYDPMAQSLLAPAICRLSAQEREVLLAHGALLEEFGLDIAPTEKLKNLSAAMQQMVEIIKVYSRRPKLIAFDEPTTALTEAEAEKLFYIIEEKLKKQDIIILYVSHRMNEVFRLSDRIVVFKDGELVHTAVTAETDEEAIVQRMVGRPLEKVFGELKRNAPAEDCILRVTGYSGRGFQDASFTLRRGEVIGFYGLVGAGRTELMRGIFGADEISGGQLELNGECLRFTSPGQAVKKGVAFLTEDRKDQGIFSQQGVRENISVVSLKKLKNLWFLSSRKENQFAREQCEKLTVKTLSLIHISEPTRRS